MQASRRTEILATNIIIITNVIIIIAITIIIIYPYLSHHFLLLSYC